MYKCSHCKFRTFLLESGLQRTPGCLSNRFLLEGFFWKASFLCFILEKPPVLLDKSLIKISVQRLRTFFIYLCLSECGYSVSTLATYLIKHYHRDPSHDLLSKNMFYVFLKTQVLPFTVKELKLHYAFTSREQNFLLSFRSSDRLFSFQYISVISKAMI